MEEMIPMIGSNGGNPTHSSTMCIFVISAVCLSSFMKVTPINSSASGLYVHDRNISTKDKNNRYHNHLWRIQWGGILLRLQPLGMELSCLHHCLDHPNDISLTN